MQTIKSYEDLQCRKLSVELCEAVYTMCEKAWIPTDDELWCRRYIAALSVSWKIAFSYGPQDTDWFQKWMPVAKKYAAETLFWAWIALTKGKIKKKDYKKIERLTRQIIKKIDAIIRYLHAYGEQEKYRWNVFFKEIG